MLRIGILERLVYAAAELTGMEAPGSLSEIPSQFASPPQANEIVVANCFHSLRLLSTTDWQIFFEQTSRVEQILRDDPADVYAEMDFDTRNSYRSVVEELARYSTFSEEEVALAAIELARNSGSKPSGRRQTHVGFYLRDAGRSELEARIRYHPGLGLRIHRALLAVPTATYLGSIAIFTVLFVLGLLVYASLSGGSLAQHHRGLPWVWIVFRSRDHSRELECNPSCQTPKPASHGFFGGHTAGQPHHGGRPLFAGKHR